RTDGARQPDTENHIASLRGPTTNQLGSAFTCGRICLQQFSESIHGIHSVFSELWLPSSCPSIPPSATGHISPRCRYICVKSKHCPGARTRRYPIGPGSTGRSSRQTSARSRLQDWGPNIAEYRGHHHPC